MKEKNGRSGNKISISFTALLIFIAMAVTSINACGYLGILGELSWKEEVLLHDGSKIIVKRWQKLKTVYTFEPSALIKEQSISFKLPGTNKKIAWKDGPAKDVMETVNFTLIALHIKNNKPYLITSPYGCLSFNKWGRPNPSYIVFTYEGKEWNRIDMTNLPPEFRTVNLVQGTMNHKVKVAIGQGLLTAEKIKALNEDGNKSEIYKTIVRTPFKGSGQGGCPEMVYDGRKWMGIGFFNRKANYEECLVVCKETMHDIKYCPCSRLFPNNKKGE
ncbi:MAG: hypothetical protein NTW65_11235 [Deltaproteobacteria bacterium]|nr:hypothetical protein [Deltaproteobacteria bacterium]